MSNLFSKYLPAILSGVSAVSQAKDTRNEASWSAAQLRTNASYSRMRAEDAKARGGASAMAAVVKARMTVGSQRAALAAQGIDISSGSALDVQVNTAELSDIDIMTIKNNAAREAWGYGVQAGDYDQQAKMAEQAGGNRSRNTLITGGLNMLRLIS
jgi:hypothetical protein